jgi:4-aminobutyrate aminotransferase-like enzyme
MTIMDMNAHRGADESISDDVREIMERRSRVLGQGYRLFYREPVHLVRGQGAYLWDAAGHQYLDMYNNVPSVGHGHPRVVAAVAEQMATLNTHTRYLHRAVVDYAEDLLGTMPESIDRLMLMCSGSEANDVAIRVARAYTGGEGIVVTSESYHGNTALTSGHSPALGAAQPLDPAARLIAPPDGYRIFDPTRLGAEYAAEMQRVIDAMTADGIRFAGFLADTIFSSDGVFAHPVGLLGPVVDVVHRNGGVVIADEVQPGFARTGVSFWGFGMHGVEPDIVTMGKPMGNGIPISGLAAKAEVLGAYADRMPYFNTFGGNPVSVAAAQAVLDVIRDEDLQRKALVVGAALRSALTDLAKRHELIGDVRGSGQFTGLELVTDRSRRTPAGPLAIEVVEGLRHRGVLTSVAGRDGNILKLRPPLAFAEDDIAWVVDALDAALADVRDGQL